jgi:hypothetical protein
MHVSKPSGSHTGPAPTPNGDAQGRREVPSPQRTLQSYSAGKEPSFRLAGSSILPPCEPWSLTPENRRLCLAHKFGLVHKVRIHAAQQVRIVKIRDTSLAISDRHLAREGAVQVAPLPSRQGIFTHLVLTGAGWKKIRENAKTGEFTTGGRARQGPFWLNWNPTPPILTIMRAKGLAELSSNQWSPPR